MEDARQGRGSSLHPRAHALGPGARPGWIVRGLSGTTQMQVRGDACSSLLAPNIPILWPAEEGGVGIYLWCQ